MHRPFPILDLPHLPMMDVLKNANLISLINLSLCSTRSNRVVRSFRLRKSLRWEVKFGESDFEVKTIYQGTNEEWIVRESECSGIVTRPETDNRCIVHCANAKVFTDYLLSLEINFRDVEMFFKNNFTDIRDLPIISAPGFRAVCLEKEEVTGEEIEHIQSVYSNLDTMVIHSQIAAQPHYTAPTLIVNVPHLNSFSVAFDSQYVWIRNCNSLFANFLTICDLWKTGTRFVNLKSLIVFKSDFDEARLSFLGGKRWDPRKRARRYVTKYNWLIDCSEGVDLEDANGRLATAVVKGAEFFFLVWDNRFPVEPIAPNRIK